jgi:tRNA A37 methylthiotransferase MiaB
VKIGMPKVYVTTNGCDEGQLKSMHVQQFFIKNGFAVTRDPTQADQPEREAFADDD